MSVGSAALPLLWICTPFFTSGKVEHCSIKISPKTHLGSFLDHGKVEFILISLRCLLLETIEAVLLRVVIPCALDIVLMFL